MNSGIVTCWAWSLGSAREENMRPTSVPSATDVSTPPGNHDEAESAAEQGSRYRYLYNHQSGKETGVSMTVIFLPCTARIDMNGFLREYFC